MARRTARCAEAAEEEGDVSAALVKEVVSLIAPTRLWRFNPMDGF